MNLINSLKDTLKAFDDFKNKQESSWSIVFWYGKVFILRKYIQYTIYWDKTQMLKNISFGQNKWYKKCPLFFYSRAPTHHSLSLNLWFLYELKQKPRLSKTVCGISHRFRFVFIKVFFFDKMHGLFDFKTS